MAKGVHYSSADCRLEAAGFKVELDSMVAHYPFLFRCDCDRCSAQYGRLSSTRYYRRTR
jgi:hypothetical protein